MPDFVFQDLGRPLAPNPIAIEFVPQNHAGDALAWGIVESPDRIGVFAIDLEFGEVIWTFSYGGIYNDVGYSLVYSDGGWTLAGQTYSYDIGGGDAWLIKVSETGVFAWMQMYGKSNTDTAYDIDIASDGGYIICGSTFIQGNQYDLL